MALHARAITATVHLSALKPDLTPTILARLLNVGALNLVALEMAKNEIALVVESSADAPSLQADAHQLKQVLINLVRNAAESIGRKGSITLRVRQDSLSLQGWPQDVTVLEV